MDAATRRGHTLCIDALRKAADAQIATLDVPSPRQPSPAALESESRDADPPLDPHVVAFLEEAGVRDVDGCAAALSAEDVDLDALLLLTADDLASLHIKLGSRRKILAAIEKRRAAAAGGTRGLRRRADDNTASFPPKKIRKAEKRAEEASDGSAEYELASVRYVRVNSKEKFVKEEHESEDGSMDESPQESNLGHQESKLGHEQANSRRENVVLGRQNSHIRPQNERIEAHLPRNEVQMPPPPERHVAPLPTPSASALLEEMARDEPDMAATLEDSFIHPPAVHPLHTIVHRLIPDGKAPTRAADFKFVGVEFLDDVSVRAQDAMLTLESIKDDAAAAAVELRTRSFPGRRFGFKPTSRLLAGKYRATLYGAEVTRVGSQAIFDDYSWTFTLL